jgi:acyl-CoA synthetase (AMP-forming)/AMP-acid ligase II
MTEAVTNWNFADVWDVVARVHPERPALVYGDRRVSWADFERRAGGVAASLVAAGLGHQAKVAQYLYNCPEYLESLYGAFKAGLVPVNTNYRYTADELAYLWDNSDTEAVVFHGSFAELAGQVRPRVGVRLWLWVDDDTAPCPEWAQPYEAAASAPPLPPTGQPRSGDDLLFVYTGGTTGMPKGVMWRQDDLFATLNKTGELRYSDEGGLDAVAAVLAAPSRHAPARLVPGPPLMHGTGLFTAMSVLNSGGRVIIPTFRRFDVEALLDLIEAEGATQISIVGDAFAKPILAALDEHPNRWDLSSLWLMVSSGVMWSAEVKAGLMRHCPTLTLVDTLGSSEAIGIARSTSKAGQSVQTAAFVLGPDAKVIDEDGREIQPGSGNRGRLALRGRGPIGYYKDPEKSAATFMVIDGGRYSIPGDFATVDADGSIQLLGRGSVCINTGGEKVFPEEVEEILKLHPSVADAVVVGVPDDRFGEVVTGVIELRSSSSTPESASVSAELVELVRSRLAAYKAPKHIVVVDTIGRSPSGKVDYRRLREHAVAETSG